MKLAVALVGLICAIGCKDQATADHRPAAGKERGDCRADKDQACDPGLWCLSNLCVRPPPADCTAVADQLASLELGNYAEPEDREPVVAAHRKACEKAYVTKEQGACVEAATDLWTAKDCAPTMFPQDAQAQGDCNQVMAKVRAAMAQQATAVVDPKTQMMMSKLLTGIQQSCEQDGWPPALKGCVVAAPDSADAMSACDKHVSPELRQKISERLMQVMQ